MGRGGVSEAKATRDVWMLQSTIYLDQLRRGMGWNNWGEADIAPMITCEEHSDGEVTLFIIATVLLMIYKGTRICASYMGLVLEFSQRGKRGCGENLWALKEQMRGSKCPNPQNSPSICGWSKQKIWLDSLLPPLPNIFHIRLVSWFQF